MISCSAYNSQPTQNVKTKEIKSYAGHLAFSTPLCPTPTETVLNITEL
jgi:hypothetical protein